MIDVSSDSVRQSQHAPTLTLTLSLSLSLNINTVTLRTCDPSDLWPFGPMTLRTNELSPFIERIVNKTSNAMNALIVRKVPSSAKSPVEASNLEKFHVAVTKGKMSTFFLPVSPGVEYTNYYKSYTCKKLKTIRYRSRDWVIIHEYKRKS